MKRAAASWEHFWFTPEPTSTLAVVRIAYGTLVVLWALTLMPDLLSFFSTSGVLPEQPRYDWQVGLFQVFSSDAAVILLWLLLVAGAVSLALGYRTRLAAVVTFVVLMSFQRRNPFMMNAGDRLIRILGFYLMFAPSGVSLSLDRWRRARQAFWEFPARAPWALRLIQIQVSVVYLFTVWAKVRGATWSDGTAVFYAVRIGDLVRLRVPDVVAESLLIVNLLTWGTLAVELALAVLIWNRRLRPWVIALGVALHLGIELTMRLGFFSMAVFVSYLAFVPPETMSRFVLKARDRRRGREGRGAPPRTQAKPKPARKRDDAVDVIAGSGALDGQPAQEPVRRFARFRPSG